jgi:hypothetical protein
MAPNKNGQELLCAHIQPRTGGKHGMELNDTLPHKCPQDTQERPVGDLRAAGPH